MFGIYNQKFSRSIQTQSSLNGHFRELQFFLCFCKDTKLCLQFKVAYNIPDLTKTNGILI